MHNSIVLAVAFGTAFLVAGTIGFTSNPLVSSEAAMLTIDPLHSFMHVLFGVLLLVVASLGHASMRTADI